MYFPLCNIRGYINVKPSHNGESNHEYVVKTASANSLHFKGDAFLLVINKQITGQYF